MTHLKRPYSPDGELATRADSADFVVVFNIIVYSLSAIDIETLANGNGN